MATDAVSDSKGSPGGRSEVSGRVEGRTCIISADLRTYLSNGKKKKGETVADGVEDRMVGRLHLQSDARPLHTVPHETARCVLRISTNPHSQNTCALDSIV